MTSIIALFSTDQFILGSWHESIQLELSHFETKGKKTNLDGLCDTDREMKQYQVVKVYSVLDYSDSTRMHRNA